jgi:hypothetical protein
MLCHSLRLVSNDFLFYLAHELNYEEPNDIPTFSSITPLQMEPNLFLAQQMKLSVQATVLNSRFIRYIKFAIDVI